MDRGQALRRADGEDLERPTRPGAGQCAVHAGLRIKCTAGAAGDHRFAGVFLAHAGPVPVQDRHRGGAAVWRRRSRRHGVPDLLHRRQHRHGGSRQHRPLHAGLRDHPRVRPRLLLRHPGLQRVRGTHARRGHERVLEPADDGGAQAGPCAGASVDALVRHRHADRPVRHGAPGFQPGGPGGPAGRQRLGTPVQWQLQHRVLAHRHGDAPDRGDGGHAGDGTRDAALLRALEVPPSLAGRPARGTGRRHRQAGHRQRAVRCLHLRHRPRRRPRAQHQQPGTVAAARLPPAQGQAGAGGQQGAGQGHAGPPRCLEETASRGEGRRGPVPVSHRGGGASRRHGAAADAAHPLRRRQPPRHAGDQRRQLATLRADHAVQGGVRAA